MINFDEKAAAIFAAFAQNAQDLADAALRASKGEATDADKAILENAWEESGRHGYCRGLLVESGTSDMSCYMNHFFGHE